MIRLTDKAKDRQAARDINGKIHTLTRESRDRPFHKKTDEHANRDIKKDR